LWRMADTDTLRTLADKVRTVSEQLTAPGAPFEVHEEEVLGERMPVFANRHESLRSVLESSARFADRDCLVFDNGLRVTFDDLQRDVASFAAALRDRYGIGKGDHVAICGANSPGWIEAFWACTALGAVVVAMNGWWTTTEIEHALELTEPKVLLADAKRLERVGDTDVPTVDLDAEFESLRGHDRAAALPDTPIDEDDPAMLIFTSGTTGRPKAAVLTHRVIVAFCQLQSYIGAQSMLVAGREMTPGAVPPNRLAVMPLFHVSGLSAIVSSLMTGTTTVWPLGRFDAGRVIQLTKEERIGMWSGASTHVLRLLDHPDIESIDPTTILSVGIGGSASTPDLIRRTEERFPHLKGSFSSGYGSTESGGLISYASNAMLVAAPECVGPLLPTVQVRIVDDEGNDVPEGDEGNICCRSPLVMREYWRHPEANAEAFLPGRWLRVGDVGRMVEGTIFLASRKRDLIIRGGENVYPFEVEYRLEEHPDVRETAVFGVDHPIFGQEVKAVVVLEPGSTVTPAALKQFCAEVLSNYKVPAHVEIRDEALPRNASGKIMKHVIAGQAENTFEED
jgi:long-chain acyl-CoA synthetase